MLGHASLSGNIGNKENGNGEYLLSAESVYPLQRISKYRILLGDTRTGNH